MKIKSSCQIINMNKIIILTLKFEIFYCNMSNNTILNYCFIMKFIRKMQNYIGKKY